MRIKIINAEDYSINACSEALEKYVNYFLEDINSNDVININYSNTYNFENKMYCLSAMIVLK